MFPGVAMDVDIDEDTAAGDDVTDELRWCWWCWCWWCLVPSPSPPSDTRSWVGCDFDATRASAVVLVVDSRARPTTPSPSRGTPIAAVCGVVVEETSLLVGRDVWESVLFIIPPP